MILFFIYILLFIFENLLFPAIAGPEFFLITPIFILAIIINVSNFKKSMFQLVVFSLIGEFFIGAQIGSSLIPLIMTAFIYFAINHFIEMRASLDNLASFPVILGRSFILLCLSYSYLWFFIFFRSSYGFDMFTVSSIYASWDAWRIFLDLGTIVTIFIWSCLFSIIFAYVLKTK